MQLTIEQLLKILYSEVRKYKFLIAIAFAVISLVGLITGIFLPEKYVSFALIISEEQNIINPLMEGRASTAMGNQRDRVSIARELLFSKNIMDSVLRDAGLINDNTPPALHETIANTVQKNTSVSRVGTNNLLIRIEYANSDPEQSYIVAKKFSEKFVEQSTKDKQREAIEAFNSIGGQVKEYQQRLVEAENKLKDLRSGNINATPGNETEVNARISQLKQRIEQAHLELSEADIRKKSIEDQLSGEAESTVVLTRENQYRTRIAELQSELDTLRLNYLETYPDIVRIKHQIEDLRDAVSKEKQRAKLAKEQGKKATAHLDEQVTTSQLYQQLKTDLSQTKTTIATLHSRISENQDLLNKELQRAKRIAEVEAQLAELTRDYNINKATYQDLSQRRENARVSLNLTMEQQGPSLRIQEPAQIPLNPTGPQFLHIAMASLLLGALIPIGIIYSMIALNYKIYSEDIITEKYKLNVLANIPYIESLSEKELNNKETMKIFIIVSVIMVIYVVVTLLKLKKLI